MKWEDFLDLTLREVLEKFCSASSLECGNYYGIFKKDDIDKVFTEFDIEKDYPEAFFVDELINFELIGTDVRDHDTLLTIMNNLGVSKK